MPEIMTIPAAAYRAFKVLPMQKGQSQPQFRYAECVRIGVTAYDFTMTFSDGFAVTKALATICSKGAKDGGDSICSLDIGTSPDMPLKMSSYVHRDQMSVDALVMPVRM